MQSGSGFPDRIQHDPIKYVKKVTLLLTGPKSNKDTNSNIHRNSGSVSIEAMVPEGEELSVSVTMLPADTLRTEALSATVPKVTDNQTTAGTCATEVIAIDPEPSSPAAGIEIPASIHQSIRDISLSSLKGTFAQQATTAAVSSPGLQQEKARAMFEKHALTLEPHEWPSGGARKERIEKPIRLRIHRHCHRCQSDFGPDKSCLNCAHKRCTKCPRSPGKGPRDRGDHQDSKASEPEVEEHVVENSEVGKSEAAKLEVSQPEIEKPEAEQVLIEKLEVEILETSSTPKLTVLTKLAKNGRTDLVHKPVSQRIHRICHKCETEFFHEEKICAYCRHLRCKICPRDPPKADKYPDGYPGDADLELGQESELYIPPKRVFKKIRRRIRWTCHACSTLYYEKSKLCSSCQHRRCRDCARDPPKKIMPVPSAELLKSIEDKLAHLGVIHQSVVTKAA
ncbi:MAG: hypothetical protein M1812_001899 [Candelaria pacifica]|nr:MAG: hypothetical protein M1812_001899 [Candelaria pacifica]